VKPKEKASSASSPLDRLLGGAKEKSEKPSKKKGPKHKKSLVEAHYDTEGKSKGYTVRHSPDTPDEVSYTAKDLAGVKDGLDEHLGGEELAEAPAALSFLGGKK
jgi:hypothetical protein